MIIAIYPGTFDPITKGHLDIIKRAIKFVDKLIIAVSKSSNKKTLFSISERINLINNVLEKEKIKKVSADSFEGLLMNYAKKKHAKIVIRGLRAVSDFEYEFQLAGMNKKLNANIETMFLMSDVENQIISSKFVKEIANLRGDINRFVTKYASKMLKNKYL